ncbi:hypothetical protein [Coprococcus comes]|uniref:Uncharacterized protein n=1 Tax=Coprococcus comes TaxID=410072 RepID=A0A3R6GYM2_9FIRM|nr:hypothetical protein [Coprococcus comes]RHF81924.1 hypothetical protein DW656_12650 [Coprococcus comes]
MRHQIDWSATAAWIALAISIISPAITTLLTNHHQLKLRKLDIREKHADTYNTARISTIEEFISKVSKYISHPSASNEHEYAECYFRVYTYVPQSLWPFLDDLNENLTSNYSDDTLILFRNISKSLACLLKEEPLILPSEWSNSPEASN